MLGELSVDNAVRKMSESDRGQGADVRVTGSVPSGASSREDDEPFVGAES